MHAPTSPKPFAVTVNESRESGLTAAVALRINEHVVDLFFEAITPTSFHLVPPPGGSYKYVFDAVGCSHKPASEIADLDGVCRSVGIYDKIDEINDLRVKMGRLRLSD